MCDHAKLKELVQPLLLPCLRLVLSGVASAQQLQSAHEPASSMAAEGGHAAPFAASSALQGSMHRQLLEQSAQQGAAWLMLGALRLHLVSTPAGPDPAAKPAHKRSHLLNLITRTDAELLVWSSMPAWFSAKNMFWPVILLVKCQKVKFTVLCYISS